MADSNEPRPALKLRVGVAFHAGTDEGKLFEIFQPGELLHPDIGQLAVVDEPEHFQIRELAQRRDPLIAEFGGDDVERFQPVKFVSSSMLQFQRDCACRLNNDTMGLLWGRVPRC